MDLLHEWDETLLGHVVHNAELDDNRRKPWVTINRHGHHVDEDERYGRYLAHRFTVQELLDKYPHLRRKLKRCLFPLRILRLPWQ